MTRNMPTTTVLCAHTYYWNIGSPWLSTHFGPENVYDSRAINSYVITGVPFPSFKVHKIAFYGQQTKQLYQVLRHIYAINQPRITVTVPPLHEPISSTILMSIRKGQPTKHISNKPLVTLTGSFKNIFIRRLHRTTAIFYTQIKYAAIILYVSFLPPDCVTTVSGQNSHQWRTRGLTKGSQHENSTVHTNIKVISWVTKYKQCNKLPKLFMSCLKLYLCVPFMAFSVHGSTAIVGLGLLIFGASWLHLVALLWTDQPIAETYTWQHTTVTRDRRPCPRRDLNPPSQQASGWRPTS